MKEKKKAMVAGWGNEPASPEDSVYDSFNGAYSCYSRCRRFFKENDESYVEEVMKLYMHLHNISNTFKSVNDKSILGSDLSLEISEETMTLNEEGEKIIPLQNFAAAHGSKAVISEYLKYDEKNAVPAMKSALIGFGKILTAETDPEKMTLEQFLFRFSAVVRSTIDCRAPKQNIESQNFPGMFAELFYDKRNKSARPIDVWSEDEKEMGTIVAAVLVATPFYGSKSSEQEKALMLVLHNLFQDKKRLSKEQINKIGKLISDAMDNDFKRFLVMCFNTNEKEIGRRKEILEMAKARSHQKWPAEQATSSAEWNSNIKPFVEGSERVLVALINKVRVGFLSYLRAVEAGNADESPEGMLEFMRQQPKPAQSLECMGEENGSTPTAAVPFALFISSASQSKPSAATARKSLGEKAVEEWASSLNGAKPKAKEVKFSEQEEVKKKGSKGKGRKR